MTPDGSGATPAAALLVLAKPPHPGTVKTRLCPPASPERAADIAAAALLDTIDAVRGVPGGFPVVALSGELAGAARESELATALEGTTVIKQRGETLGERICAAHEDTAALFPDLPVLQIGMDTPQLDAGLLGSCRHRLLHDGNDAVLGPATDGGWWLLGLRDPLAARAVVGVPTSRPDTGSHTATALREYGLRLGRLETLTDVDTVADAWAVAGTAPDTRFAAAVRELA